MSRRPIGVPFKEFHARSLDDVDDELAKTWHFTGRPLEHATQHRHEAKNENTINGQFSQNTVLPMHLQLLETSSSCSQVGTSAVRKSTRLITDATVEVSRGVPDIFGNQTWHLQLTPGHSIQKQVNKGTIEMKWANEQTHERMSKFMDQQYFSTTFGYAADQLVPTQTLNQLSGSCPKESFSFRASSTFCAGTDPSSM